MTSIFYQKTDEERLLGEYLPNTGFYVDIGANDPVVESQSWFLEQRGWNGLLVEPQPRLAERLRQHRNATVVQKACGAPADVGKVLSLTILGTNAALFPDRVFDQYDDAERVDVEIDTLDHMLSEAGVTAIDFLSIDVEGYEVEALSGLDFVRYAPRLILIEDHLFNLAKHRFLKGHGYKWVRRTQFNNWYIRQSEAFPLSLIDKLLLWRKMYIGMPFRRLKKWLRSSASQ